jgi:hypothetical protein
MWDVLLMSHAAAAQARLLGHGAHCAHAVAVRSDPADAHSSLAQSALN